MRYVIIRDDDTNAFTRTECLDMLYRPFLDRNLPVNLAVIPAVASAARMADGSPEGFLPRDTRGLAPLTPIGENRELVAYLKAHEGYKIVQHGCHHEFHEFDSPSREAITARLDQGSRHLTEAGFPQPKTFVAPYDKISREGMQEISARFPVISTGWFELGRMPFAWWPKYILKKLRNVPHFSVGRTVLLSHPGCLLSYNRSYSTMLGAILHHVNSSKLTVLVTHWWEYFRNGTPDEPFIGFLHETASYLATHPDIRVISFSDLVDKSIPLN